MCLQSLSFNGDNQQTKLLLLQMLSYKQGSINDMVRVVVTFVRWMLSDIGGVDYFAN